MKKHFLLLILFVVVAVIWILFSAFSRKRVMEQRPQVTIGNATFNVEIADNVAKRARGLSGRDSLKENEGMLFLFNQPAVQNFWMKEMNFPIDIVWIMDDRVVGFAENASMPVTGEELPIYSSPELADKVLEINAGLVKKYNIKVSDKADFNKELF